MVKNGFNAKTEIKKNGAESGQGAAPGPEHPAPSARPSQQRRRGEL